MGQPIYATPTKPFLTNTYLELYVIIGITIFSSTVFSQPARPSGSAISIAKTAAQAVCNPLTTSLVNQLTFS